MKKFLLTFAVSATLLLGAMGLVANANAGVCDIYQGCTGRASTTQGDLLVGTSSLQSFGVLHVGTNGYVLTASSSAPTGLAWTQVSGGSGTVGPSTSTYVAVFNSSGTIKGYASLSYNSTTQQLSDTNGDLLELDGGDSVLEDAGGDFVSLANGVQIDAAGGTPNLQLDSNGQLILQPRTSSGTVINDTASNNNASLDTSLLTGNQNYQFPNSSGIFCLTSTCLTTSTFNATGTAFYFPYWNSGGTALSPTSSIFISSSTGKVGIGTSQPSSTLHVVGTATITSSTYFGGTLNVTSTATFQATSTFLGNVSTTIAANSFVATNGQGILIATGTPSGGSGTVTTSTAFTSGNIPIINGATSIGNSTISQPGGGLTDVGGVPILDGGGDYIGPNIFMSTTSTVVVGNFVQGGGVEQFNTTTTITGAQFCAGGLIDIIKTTSSITITLPTTSTIAAASCGSSIWAGTFAQQYMRNDSTNTVFNATNGSNEIQEYSAGTPTSLAPGQEYFIAGQFTNSSTVQGATSTGTNLVVHYTLFQTSTPLTVSGNSVQINGVNVATSTGISSGSCTNCNLTYNANGGLTVAANGSSGGGSAASTTMNATWVVAASGGSTTTIQGGLNLCGSKGGGTVFVEGGTYAQGSTGLLWEGSNCTVLGVNGTTTITFTGNTTGFATASSGAEYSNDELHNVTITGDGTSGSTAIDASNMSHAIYDDVIMDDWSEGIKLHDTKDITFYNLFENLSMTTIGTFGIDGSSTEPWNGNLFQNIFIGCSTSNCVSVDDGNSEHNTFQNIYEEPAGAPLTGSIGVKIFDSNTGSNPGNFGNMFINNYIEGNATAISVAAPTSCGSGECIAGDIFEGGITDTNGTITIPTSTGVTLQDVNVNFVPATVLSSHVGFTGTGSNLSPSLGTCTNGKINGNSNDNDGQITIATSSVSSCAVNFAESWNVAPVCLAGVASGTPAALACKTTTSGITITAAAAFPTSTIISYHVFGMGATD